MCILELRDGMRRLLRGLDPRLGDDVAPQRQDVHPRPQKAVERLRRLVDDGLVFVERGIEQHRYTRVPMERANELPVNGIRVAADGLQTSGAIDVRDG